MSCNYTPMNQCFHLYRPMHTCDHKNHQKLANCESLTNEGQIEVKREPMPYTMQSTLYSCSNTAALAEGKTYSKKRKRSFSYKLSRIKNL